MNRRTSIYTAIVAVPTGLSPQAKRHRIGTLARHLGYPIAGSVYGADFISVAWRSRDDDLAWAQITRACARAGEPGTVTLHTGFGAHKREAVRTS